MLDDASRVVVGTRLYAREVLPAYLDFLDRSFATYGLPLALYVDHHSFFFTSTPEARTYLGECVHFYDIEFRYAPTPQAKGKVERLHRFWQNRLPAYVAAESIDSIAAANEHLDALRQHHNGSEIHRELGCPPDQLWRRLRRAGRSCLRPKPRCPWWPYIWSIRALVKVTLRGTVVLGGDDIRVSFPPGTRLIHCSHPDGSHTLLRFPPRSGKRPLIVARREAPPVLAESLLPAKRKV